VSKRRQHIESVAAQVKAGLIGERRRGDRDESFEDHLRRLVTERAATLAERDREAVVEQVRRETVGLGPLEDLLADPEVDEILINGHRRLYVEKGGRLQEVAAAFESEEELRDAIERILAPVGRRVDELQPMADARLHDGSRVNVIIPPLAVDGPAVSIRRFARRRPSLLDLVENRSLSGEMAEFLAEAVADRRTILISGGTGAGKTTLLNALSEHIGAGERVVTIEDAAELQLAQPHLVRLESRPATVEGRGEVTIRDLLRNALRMRPDRIILGEVRGNEALDLLTALNTGHEGALSTVHANSPADALRRLQNLCLMGGVGLPHEAIRDQLARGLDLIVQIVRRPDGRRQVVEIGEVAPDPGSGAVQPLFRVEGSRGA
jgi:pilus assembly protein CpaF